MNALVYKNYTGVFEYIPGDEAFHGHVIGMRDVVHFSGRSIDELQRSLAEGVEDYLSMCAEEGVPPEKPYSGKLGLRLDPDIHRKAAAQARTEGKSLNTWITGIVTKEIETSS